MDSFEWNKVFAAFLVVGILMSVLGYLAKVVVHTEELTEHAFVIEGVEAASSGHTAVKKQEEAEPILALLVSADVAKGQKLSRACAACHNFESGGANGVGPNLYGVVGRAKAAVSGYAYSSALEEKGGKWDYQALNQFLWKPKKYIEGTKMNYIGLRKPEDRAAMIAWLRTLSSNPVAMPNAAEIAAEAVVENEEAEAEANGAADTGEGQDAPHGGAH